MDWLRDMITEIRSLRMDMNVPAGAKIPVLVKDAAPNVLARLSAYGEIFRRMARLESVTTTNSTPPGAVQTVVAGAVVILPLAGVVDLAAERERLKKTVQKLEQEIAKIDQQLGNERFVASAPAEIVEENRARKAEVAAKAEKLGAALKQMGAG